MYPDRILSEKLLIGSVAVNGMIVVVYASGLVSTSCAALGESYSGDVNKFFLCAVGGLISLFVVERLKKRTTRRFVVLINLIIFLNAAAASIDNIGAASNDCAAGSPSIATEPAR